MKVTILDMQPIEPTTGGGRFALTRSLSRSWSRCLARLMWAPTIGRDRAIADTCSRLHLKKSTFRLTEEHFHAADVARQRAGGRGVIDCVFHDQAYLSPDYVAQAKKVGGRGLTSWLFSHPWTYPLVRRCA